MLYQPSFLGLALGLLLKGASAAPYHLAGSKLSRRWDTSVCTAENSGVPIPDSDNFQLPLENWRQDMCWDFCVGDQTACTTKSKVCYNFMGYNLIFDYQAVPGYTYAEADIWLGLSAPTAGYSSPNPQFTSSNGYCTIATDALTVHCSIPYSQITSSPNVLSGMCPNGDRQGFIFYLYTNAQLKDTTGASVQGEGRLSCTDYPTCSSYQSNTYWELAYRCSKCPVVSTSSPPSTSVSSTSIGSTSTSFMSSSSTSTGSMSTTSTSTSSTQSSSTPVSSTPASSTPTSTTSASTTSTSSISTSSTSISSTSTSSSSTSTSFSSASSSSSSASSSFGSTPIRSMLTSSTPASSTPASSAPASSAPASSALASSASTTSTSSSSTPTPSSVTKYCSFGTAFGYSSVNPSSLTLNSITPRPNTCNRWGWYSTPTTAQLSSGIGGPLYVGAGQNDLSKATNVGTWSAMLSGGNVYVKYSLSSAYSLAEVHVDVGCLPFATCSPGQYTYVNEGLTSPATTSFTTPALRFPSCSTGKLYLIVHASVNKSSTSSTCPAPVAT